MIKTVRNISKSNQQVLFKRTFANTLLLHSLNSSLSFFGSASFFQQPLLLLIAFNRFVEVSFLLQVSVTLSIKSGFVLIAHLTAQLQLAQVRLGFWGGFPPFFYLASLGSTTKEQGGLTSWKRAKNKTVCKYETSKIFQENSFTLPDSSLC